MFVYTASIQAATVIVRTAQIVNLALHVTSYFLPVIGNALKLAAAHLVLTALASYQTGTALRSFMELRLGPAIANGLNQFTYVVNPHLAPSAQPVDYLVEVVHEIEIAPELISDLWILPTTFHERPARVLAIDSFVCQLVLPPARELTLPDLALPDLSAMTREQLAQMAKAHGLPHYKPGQNRRQSKNELVVELRKVLATV